METHSQMDNVPCPSCRKFIPKTDVRNESGRKMNVSRLVALVNPVTRIASWLERLLSCTETLLITVDLPASHSEIALKSRFERYEVVHGEKVLIHTTWALYSPRMAALLLWLLKEVSKSAQP